MTKHIVQHRNSHDSGSPGAAKERRLRRGRHPLFNALAAMSLLVSLLAAFDVNRADEAVAEVPPVLDTDDSLVTADALPTVQVDGVVWDQEIVGNTVYAVGNFTKARPAGAAPGTNEVPRNNILAYNLSTGVLINSFAPSLNREGRVVTAAPDGSKIFVGGLFTDVSGIAQYRITALDPVTGAVDMAFSAVVDYRVNAIAVTDTTVYVGGKFGTASSYSPPATAPVSRSNLAAFDRVTGSVLPWNPSADAEVLGIVMPAGKGRVFAAGKFANVGGQTNRGLAAMDATGSGNVINWPATQVVWASGNAAAIMSISTDGEAIYGSGYHFGQGGNLEGTFSADAMTGVVNFVQDCHGDTYDASPIAGNLYTVSHVHFCGNIGGFAQSDPWITNGRYALALSTSATGTNRRDPWGYPNWEGTPAPSIKAWYPDFAVGTIAGQSTWTIEGNDDYVVVGGEFPRVNYAPQQGLVRFAKRSIAPGKEGPRLGGGNFDFNVQSYSAGEVRVSFPANYDRDNSELTYRIMRDGDNANPVHETTQFSTPWDRPVVSFTDTGLTPGSTHSYVINALDPDGNTAWSNSKTIKVATSGAPSPYADAVAADSPYLHWRFNDASGSGTAAAGTGTQTGSVGSTSRVSFGAAGAMLNEPNNRAANFSNYLASHVTGEYTPALDSFSVEAWVKTNTRTGGRIIGYANKEHTTSTSYDRMMYMSNNGSINFGAYPGAAKVITTRSGLNDNQWHHLVGTLGEDGMHLYVDGVIAVSNTGSDYTGGQGYNGYWKVGADIIGNWPNKPRDEWPTATIDEPAVYNKVLSPARVAAHYTASGRTPSLPAQPTDAYGKSIRQSDPVLYYRLSESSGATANDSGIRSNTGAYVGTVGRSAAGVITGNNAATFSGAGFVRSNSFYDPGHYSVQSWFKTATNTGGQIIGFGNAATGISSTADRQVVMKNGGSLAFFSGGSTIETGSSYNDDAWHHVVATQGLDGMKLYVDGTMVSSGARSVGTVYTGYWRVGGDNANGLASSNYFNGRLDEAVVNDRVLSASEVLTTFMAGGGEVPNLPPTASFTTSSNFLDVNVNGSASTDPDGSIVSYAWNFGDNATGSGATASHSYAAGGTYEITLTVTDNENATATTTRQVTVAPEPANAPPIADFSVTENGLAVATNGSASIDPDGSIVSYAWNFGDNSTGSGVSANHTYANAGTYEITLTVTDNKGATGTAKKNVTVSVPTGPVVYASDTFTRSTTNGWGDADLGGNWTTQGLAGLFNTTGTAGQHLLDAAGRTTATYLNSVSATEATASVEMSLDKPITGGGLFSYVIVRRTANSDYQVRVRAETSKTSLTLYRSVNGTTTALASTTFNDLVLTAGQTYKVSLSAEGTSPTTLSAKIWNTASTEPAAPQVTTSDNTAALQGPGGVGMLNYLSGSTTNAPLRISYDNLLVASGEDVDVPPVPNVAPVASFTGSVAGQQVSVDASGSSDSDGTIESYSWSFGDGGTATGVQADHTYANPGTYVVTLTVTDDDGDSSSAILNVTIVGEGGPVVNASDTFERSVTDGWGSANVGGLWTYLGLGSRYSVSDGVGTQFLDVAGRTTATYLGGVAETSVRASVDLSIDKPLTGGGLFSYVAVRRIGSSEYSLRIRAYTSSTNLTIYRTVNGTATAIASADLPMVLSPGNVYRASFSAVGSSPTNLSAKFWNVADGEPLADAVSATDSTAALQNPGGIGLTNYLSGSTTNAPLSVRYDNLEVAPA